MNLHNHQLTKDELKNIISGTGKTEQGNLVQAALRYLGTSKEASRESKERKPFSKFEEAKSLEIFIEQQKCWFNEIDETLYIAEGAEQKVFLLPSGKEVIKLNDSIFYTSWADYFVSLLLHNYFFPSTAYQLMGFHKKADVLYAVVKQPFIVANADTSLQSIRQVMEQNGFVLKRNNDYQSVDLGVILEDLHEENVLTQDGVLFFVDTVFYLMEGF